MLRCVLLFIFLCVIAFAQESDFVPEECINFNVHVNDKHVSEGTPVNNTVYYDIDDKITFSCSFRNATECKTLYHKIKVVFKRNGSNITVPERDSIQFISYTITADDFDNAAEVYCSVAVWSINNDYVPTQTASKRLIMNSGKHYDSTLPKVQYNERDAHKYTCNSQDNNTLTFINIRIIINDTINNIQMFKPTELTSLSSGSILYCEIIKNRGITNDSIIKDTVHYTREIYNKTLYLYNPMERNKSFSVLFGIGAVVVICVIVGSFLLLRYKKKKKTPAEDTSINQDNELYACPVQVIYADLELSKLPAPVSPARDDSTSNYVQIVGFLSRKY